MSVSAHMLVNDVDRHEGFDMIKMQIDGADGLDGSLELSVSDPDLVGSFLPGATYDLTLAAQESDGDAATSDDTDADASDADTDASADDTADTDSASSATSSSDDTAAAE